MSFATDVKEEICDVLSYEKHCRLAELSALFKFFVRIDEEEGLKVFIPEDNVAASRKFFTLLNKTYNIKANIFGEHVEKTRKYRVLSSSDANLDRILHDVLPSNPMPLLDKDCCKRAYLRGVFLATGFIFEPEKSYQLEMSVNDNEFSKLLIFLLGNFGVSAKQSTRKGHEVVYVKGVEAVSDTLNVLGAHKAIMRVANARIMKDVRNGINRRNNCDTANIIKAVSAASKQIEDITFIQEKIGLNALPDSLREIANVRLEHPDSSLTELGTFLNPPVGKSGVNHRLRKLSEFAEGLR